MKESILSEIQDIIICDMSKQPKFIDNKIYSDRTIWVAIQNYLSTISRLMVNKCLTESRVKTILAESSVSLETIIDVASSQHLRMVINYLNKCLSNYAIESVRLELYEVAHNFKLFSDLIDKDNL
jgi:hypothetical protein